MKNKKTVRMALDAAMVVLLPVLMAYSIVGETLHEIFGTAMLALFVAHHVLNRKASAAMFKGKQSPERIFKTAVNLLLFAVMILLPLSGIMMSKHLYTFLPTAGLSSAARTVHLLSSYWGFVLMSLHLGQHIDRMAAVPKSKGAARTALAVIFTAISGYGVYAFARRQIPEYMFFKTQFVFFDFDEPRIFFFIDYLSVMILFAWIGYYVKKLLHKIGGKNNG